jgi:hypothetical protein
VDITGAMSRGRVAAHFGGKAVVSTTRWGIIALDEKQKSSDQAGQPRVARRQSWRPDQRQRQILMRGLRPL